MLHFCLLLFMALKQIQNIFCISCGQFYKQFKKKKKNTTALTFINFNNVFTDFEEKN